MSLYSENPYFILLKNQSFEITENRANSQKARKTKENTFNIGLRKGKASSVCFEIRN